MTENQAKSGATLPWPGKPRSISIVVDTPGWFDAHAQQLVDQLNREGDEARLLRSATEIPAGGIAFFLSCLKITPPDILSRNLLNLVVHASALPKGRGFSPIVWQVLEGRHEIPISLLLAAEQVDAGDILMQDTLQLIGHELNTEIRSALGQKIVALCARFLSLPEPPRPQQQVGEPSWYSRRRPADSQLSPDRTLAEQFDLLRVVDNDRYPAFFDHRGFRYSLKIEKVRPLGEDDPNLAGSERRQA